MVFQDMMIPQFLKNHLNVNENLAHLQFGPVMNSVAMNSSLQK